MTLEPYGVFIGRCRSAGSCGYRIRTARMHELSIVMGIVEAAVDEAQRQAAVSAVHLRLGALSSGERV